MTSGVTRAAAELASDALFILPMTFGSARDVFARPGAAVGESGAGVFAAERWASAKAIFERGLSAFLLGLSQGSPALLDRRELQVTRGGSKHQAARLTVLKADLSWTN